MNDEDLRRLKDAIERDEIAAFAALHRAVADAVGKGEDRDLIDNLLVELAHSLRASGRPELNGVVADVSECLRGHGYPEI